MEDFGNQLFQIASTIGIAKKMGQEYNFPKWEYSKYFKNPVPQFDITMYSGKFNIYKEPTTRYHEINLPTNYSWDLEGYFQSYKYFDEYRDLINYYFTPNFEVNDLGIDQVAIHVRRGDYLNLDNHPVLPISYYKKAMAKFKNKEFYIFSDDIAWCKKNFDHETSVFIMPSGGDITDFFYMSRFKNIIIANSSFSWWAAYLGKNKKVIAPSIYVKGEDTVEDRILKEWVLV